MSEDQQSDAESRLRNAGADRAGALALLFEQQRPRLNRMVEIRLDPRLRGRIDAADVLQDAFIELSARLDDYLSKSAMPVDLWMRFVTGQKLVDCHRRLLYAKKRDVRRQVSLDAGNVFGGAPEASSVALADALISEGTSPTRAASREEQHAQVLQALEDMEPMDREVLVLRHFESMDNIEVARVLGLTKTAASNRYVRALRRLKGALNADGESA